MNDRHVLRNKNIYLIFSLTLLAVMGVASITPAFPSIAEHFQINYKRIGLLITVFTLPGIFLTPVLGVLADRFGRKTVLVPALFLFAIAGFSCSQVNSFEMLVVFRFIQGVGAASLGSLNVTLIGDIFPKEQRASAMGLNASVLSIGTAIYPFIGGSLTMIAWNFPFYFPLVAIPAGFMIMFVLESPHSKSEEKFLIYLRQTLKSIGQKKVLVLFLLNVLTFIILYGCFLTYFPFVMKSSFSSTAFMIGIILSSSSVTTAITASLLGRLSRRFRQQDLLKVSYLLYVISLSLVPFMPRESMMLIPAFFFGAAQGINIPNIQTMLVTIAPMKYRAAFMSLNGMILRIGQTLGPIIAGLFFALGGINVAFLGGAIIALSMVLIVVLFLE
ncbi:MAG: MFS transporter [Bacteroidales bacterium]|nr:MFS transporter [Bacteroidales bacterium]MCF8389906.1 MFS transporter [Bacteroidales bacterium]